MKVRAELKIHGRVQGVFFRQSTEAAATRLGLTGWVRNLPDGSVGALAEGPSDAVHELIAWCRQGPPAAEVSSVDIDWTDATGEYQAFEVR